MTRQAEGKIIALSAAIISAITAGEAAGSFMVFLAVLSGLFAIIKALESTNTYSKKGGINGIHEKES